jgi:hypothetical protein
MEILTLPYPIVSDCGLEETVPEKAVHGLTGDFAGWVIMSAMYVIFLQYFHSVKGADVRGLVEMLSERVSQNMSLQLR